MCLRGKGKNFETFLDIFEKSGMVMSYKPHGSNELILDHGVFA